MNKLIGNPMVFRQLPLEMALKKTKELGYDALELWPPQIAECKTDALRDGLRKYCEKLGTPAVRLNAADAPHFFPFKKKGDYKKILPGLLNDVDMTASLGMRHLLSWEGRIPKESTEKDRFGWILTETAELFKRACEYAHKKNIEISIEVHPYTLGIDMDWLLSFLEKVNDPSFGITYDCAHFGVGQPDTYIEAVYCLGPLIKHIHFCDSDKTSSELHFAPGTGCLDLDQLRKAFQDIKYQGTIMQDLWLYPYPEEGARIGIPYLRKLMKELNLPK